MGVPSPPGKVLPSYRLSSVERGGAAALANYQEVMQNILACFPPQPVTLDELALDLTVWHLGSLILGSQHSPALVYYRSEEIIQASGMDHLLVQYYTRGGFTGVAGTQSMEMRAGDVCVFDLAQTMRTTTTDCHIITLVVPRPLFEAVTDDVAALHGLVLEACNPLASLLADCLHSLTANAAALKADEALVVARGISALVTNILAGTSVSRMPHNGATVTSRFRDLLLYIDAHLGDPGLQGVAVAMAFGLSRAKLYRLFEPVGGVANYIRRRRLNVASLYLASPEHRDWRISQIAFACGFANEQLFSRNFKLQFGVTPREARERASTLLSAQAWTDPNLSPEREFSLWMKTLRGAALGSPLP